MNRAIVQNQDLSLNSADNPAVRGSVIAAYLTGQGAVNPAVRSGQAAPFDNHARPVGQGRASERAPDEWRPTLPFSG
jgi:uncharacterized protein (TIGR03437 family)